MHDVEVLDDERTQAAFERFFRSEYPKLIALGLGWTGDPDAASDVAQEALTRAYRGWDDVGGLERPGAWLRRVAINLLTDRHRRVARDRRLVERLDRPGSVDGPTPDDERWWRAVRALPDRQRAAVTLHYLEDLPVAEVAEILGIATGTVTATLSHARSNLRKALAEEDDR